MHKRLNYQMTMAVQQKHKERKHGLQNRQWSLKPHRPPVQLCPINSTQPKMNIDCKYFKYWYLWLKKN